MNRPGAKPLLQVSATCCQVLLARLAALTWRAEPPVVSMVASKTLEEPPQEASVRLERLRVILVPLSLAVKIPWSALVMAGFIQSDKVQAFKPLKVFVPPVWRA